MTIAIPAELLEQVERGNVLLFVGERAVRDAAGQIAIDQLASRLAARTRLADVADVIFPEASQAYEDAVGRQALIQFMRDQFETLGDEPQLVHHLIAGLTQCNVLVTTCLDRRLEHAFAEAGRPLDVIVGNVDVAFEDERRSRLYRLRGALDRVESLVLTEDDHEAFFDDQNSISVVLQGYLARKTILFLGYDLADVHFKQLYRKVTAPLDDYARRAYAFGEVLPRITGWCKRHGIDIVEVDVAAFLQELSVQMAARARPAAVAPLLPLGHAPDALPEHPYKLLDYYEASDAAIFFGRPQETQALSALIHAHRLVLLYGASGVGKTSLLLAGAIPRLDWAIPPYTAVPVRALEDPALVIRHAVRRRLPDAALPNDGSLVDFLAAAAKATDGPLVLVLDQFEEFFIRLSPQFRAAFIAELGALYDARDVPVKIVLSLREDWLAAVSEIESRIPEVFRSRLRLLPLTREQARQAITAPVERLRIVYEPALVDRLLDDLMGTTGADVLPPQLQLVCSALYGRLDPVDRTITLATYEQLGGARGVLQQYLADELARLPRHERALARGVLEDLVTSQGTKAVKTTDELALMLAVDHSSLLPVIEKLLRARLLRALEHEDGTAAYELAHEYLIREIGLGTEAQERKQAEELIQQEIENWRRFGTLLAADKLARISAVRDSLRLSAEAQDIMFRSALEVGDEVEYWLGRVGDTARRITILAAAARARSVVVRQRAAVLLGTQDAPDSVEPLLNLALHDPDLSVRDHARAAMARLTNQRTAVVSRLQAEAASSERHVRPAALRALAVLPLHDLPTGLRAQVLATRARLRGAWLAEQSVSTPLRRTLLLTTGLFLLVAVFIYATSVSFYYVTSRPSTIPGENAVVIRQGLPWLTLSGLNEEVVDTGINLSQVLDERQNDILDHRLWGFWVQRYHGYDEWGTVIFSTTLHLPDSFSAIWYLDRDTGSRALLDATRSPDPQIRRRTAEVIGEVMTSDPELATAEVASRLETLLTDDDKSVRSWAAIARAQLEAANPRLRYTSIVRALAGLLADSDRSVSSGASDALLRAIAANPEISGDLAGLLADSDSTVRGNALTMLARNPTLTPPDLASTLSKALKHPNKAIRASALSALQRLLPARRELATEEVVQSLFEQLTDADTTIRSSAIQGLKLVIATSPTIVRPVGELLEQRLQTEDDDLRVWSAYAIGSIAEDNAVIATPQTIALLAERLKDSNKSVRAWSAYALGRIKVRSPDLAGPTIETLTELLADKDKDMQRTAAWALAGLGATKLQLDAQKSPIDPGIVTSQSISTLIELLNNQQEDARRNAVKALDRLTKVNRAFEPQVAEALLRVLTDQSGPVRGDAINTLEQIAVRNKTITPQIVDELLKLLAHERSEVRVDAANCLARIASNVPADRSQVVEKLLKLISTAPRDVRVSAMNALAQVGAANSRLSPQVVRALIELRSDSDSGVRAAVAFNLGRVGTIDPAMVPTVVETLIAILNDKDSGVGPSAANTLKNIVQSNPPVARQVVEALIQRMHRPGGKR